ncbi:MAG: type II toxin-antitoxin system RelE/ParE family toxin [Planctomycetes bacterium]|jgi:mRNA-degrading endonuclease RelE of RelBE toxin-antitoxin system|nr:type II toxin-antitoxin system RelE/ParE family toxin [Planctomycetota bacterium]
MAHVEISPAADADIAGLPLVIRGRVWDIVDRLERWPVVSGAKPLRGKLAGHYRIRTGDYRVQFRVAGGMVIIEKVGHRDGFYED